MKTIRYTPRAGSFKLALQESIVLNAIQNLESCTVEEAADEARALGLKTKQTATRIVEYYLVSLRKLGLVEVTGKSDTKRRVTVVIEDEEEAA